MESAINNKVHFMISGFCNLRFIIYLQKCFMQPLPMLLVGNIWTLFFCDWNHEGQ